jgi:hypothetical protein
MKRRNFVRKLLVTPAGPVLLGAQQATTPPGVQQQPPPQPNTPALQRPRQPQNIAPLKLTASDLTAEPHPRYFSPDQFAALRKLGEVMVPPIKANPGALEAGAPEFLDFLLSVSPAERQQSYRHGLDTLNAQAQTRFRKSFAELDAAQAGSVLKPLLIPRPWPEDLPNDPLQKFIAQVHEDLRTATMNSREWVAAAEKSGHRFTQRARSVGLYWHPVDPVIET